MSQDYRDLTAVEVEDDDDDEIQLRKASQKHSPGLSWRQRICPSRRLVLILLGVSAILTIAIIVFGAKGSQRSSQLSGIRDTLTGLNQSIGDGIVSLQLKGTDTAAKITQLEAKVKKLTEEAEAAKTRLLSQMTTLQRSFRGMNCDLQNFKNNRTEACCPIGWDIFRKSCYWESRLGRPWEEAKADCEARDAHLVIINSYEEQRFVAVRVRPQYTWIGLSDASGSWKWVDGTPYTVRQSDWAPGQPDNWYGHGLGGGEDCAHLHRDGTWNDDHCSRNYGWVCEMEAVD
ncbi:C-type lectin domain-containing protein [Podarcis lilfordi]|uniref:C-type lectin domain-containing protein n=1 Tax=Podarcis lilfordi TaxID=74358 RepID=A0AA35L9H5_9SAUR|nr:C-type lectin domain-containing protein [Podarcis lilfordi]